MEKTELQMLSEIAGKVGRLEAMQESNVRSIGDMATSINRLVTKLDQSDDIAREADQRAKSAHHRIDNIDKIIFWAATTAIGAVIVGGITLMFKMKSY